MHGNESSHGSQPTQCGYRVVHRRLVLGSPISPVPSVPGRRLASSLGPFACRVDSRGGSGCGESERKAGVRRMGFRISDFGEWVYGASGIRSLGISGHRGGSPEFLRSLGKIPPRTVFISMTSRTDISKRPKARMQENSRPGKEF